MTWQAVLSQRESIILVRGSRCSSSWLGRHAMARRNSPQLWRGCLFVCVPPKKERERELEVGAGYKTLSSFPSDSLPSLHFLKSVSLGECIHALPMIAGQYHRTGRADRLEITRANLLCLWMNNFLRKMSRQINSHQGEDPAVPSSWVLAVPLLAVSLIRITSC